MFNEATALQWRDRYNPKILFALGEANQQEKYNAAIQKFRWFKVKTQ